MKFRSTLARTTLALACAVALAGVTGTFGSDAPRAGEDEGRKEVESMINEKPEDVDTTKAGRSDSAGAKASAEASASSRSDRKDGGCSARSSATAKATADGQSDYQHDEEQATETDGSCSASSHSSATVSSGKQD